MSEHPLQRIKECTKTPQTAQHKYKWQLNGRNGSQKGRKEISKYTITVEIHQLPYPADTPSSIFSNDPINYEAVDLSIFYNRYTKTLPTLMKFVLVLGDKVRQ